MQLLRSEFCDRFGEINGRFQFNIGTVWWITGPFPKRKSQIK